MAEAMTCPWCQVLAQFAIAAQAEAHGPEGYMAYMLRCGACQRYVFRLLDGNILQDGSIVRHSFPSGQSDLPDTVPAGVRSSIDQAHTCAAVQAYPAAVVMCRRALEAIGREHGDKRNLALLIAQLKEEGILPEILVRAADLTRIIGNLGAHPSPSHTDDIGKEEATAALEFVHLLVDYLYVMPDKGERLSQVAKRFEGPTEKDAE